MTLLPWLAAAALLAAPGGLWGAPPPTERGVDGTVLDGALGHLHGASQLPGQLFSPSPPDTIPPDTLPEVEPDPPADTIPELDFPPEVEGIDLEEIREEFRVLDFPQVRSEPTPSWAGGVWEWDREDLKALKGYSLVDLVEEVPGVVGLRTGDYGHPAAASAFGVTAGRIRVFLDGFEMAPLDGGMPDLSRVSLSGLDGVRVERRMSELRIHLRGVRLEDPEPYSFIHAGTGDLNTNLFSGAFAHPRVLGGNVAVSLDRLDTDGTNRRNPGSTFGGSFRYSYHPDEDLAVGVELRRSSSRRSEDSYRPRELQRTDWLVRGRWRVREGWVAEAFGGRGRLEPGGEERLEELPVEARETFDPGPRSQMGVSTRFRGDWVWADGEQVFHSGEGWADGRTSFRVGGSIPGWGGGEAGWEREWWDWGGASVVRGRLWSGPWAGITVFGEADSGRRGVPVVPAIEEADGEPDDPGVPQQTDDSWGREGGGWTPMATTETMPEEPGSELRSSQRTTLRAGAHGEWGGLALSGAWVYLSADSLPPLGLPMDRDAAVMPGGDLGGVEAEGRIPVPLLDGLALRGSVMHWFPDETPRYLPRTVWDARLAFHDTFFPTENLEVWADVGVRGRERMFSAVPAPPPGQDPVTLNALPFQPHWYFRLQIRVVTVRAFLTWENMTQRTNNQDFEERILPGMRTVWGIRWTMWD